MPGQWLTAMDVRPTPQGGHSTRVVVDGRSPWFEGHFPNRPILPGLGLLALVVQAARTGLARPDIRLHRAVKVRFKGVVLPGDELSLSLESSPSQEDSSEVQIRFQIERNEEEICGGRLVMAESARIGTGLD